MIIIVKYYNENVTDIEIMGVYRTRKEAKKWLHKVANHNHKNGKKVIIHDDVVEFDDGIMYRIEMDLWVL